MKWNIRSFPIKVISTVIILFLAWQLWVFLSPRPRDYSVAELNALKSVFSKTADRIAEKAPGPARFGVAGLANDQSDTATLILRTELASRKDWIVAEGSPVAKFLADVTKTVVKASSLDEIVNAGRQVELDIIVAGRIITVEKTQGESAQAAVQLYAYDVRKGQWIVKDTVTETWYPNPVDHAMDAIRHTKRGYRITLWIVTVLLLPWITAFATHKVLERKSNLASFVLIVIYTVADMALAMALAGGVLGGFKLLTLFVVTAGYNFWACEKIAGDAKG